MNFDGGVLGVFHAECVVLSHRRDLAQGQGRSNCETLFGMNAIPCDNHIRAMLGALEPEHFAPVFGAILAVLEGSGGIETFHRVDGHVPIALDGTE